MKKIFKYAFSALLTGTLVFTSCETVELEQLENPNALSSDQADPNLLLNSIQLNYRNAMGTFLNNSEDLTRISYFSGRDYFAAITGNTLDGAWTALYANMVPDVANITALNTEGDLNYQEGVGKALIAHTTLMMVDFVGDIPFSQINNPLEFPNPETDDDSTVYQAALAMLDEAQTLIASTSGGQDLYYNGDASKWLKFINTVKLKAAITTGDLGTFDSIIATGDFISSNDDDMQWQYGTSEVNPDARHPRYAGDYTPSGANFYQSNWIMNLMQETNDPRIRYYFTRMSDCTPGASCDPDGDGETLSCSLQTPPVHYTQGGFTFCFLENGYWGRDHGDPSGTPPDNFLRTAFGVYPQAGLFDDDTFRNVGLGVGGGGDGIRPIILASYVDFWRAERAMIAGNTGVALNFIKAGLQKSMDKVFPFAEQDVNRNTDFDADQDDVDAFIAGIEADYNAGSMEDKWNILAEQYWVTMFGGGMEAYNFYRRQGFPNTLQPNLEPDPGRFPRSFPYANGEVIANPNIAQKPDLNGQVFWDTNPPSPGFPASN